MKRPPVEEPRVEVEAYWRVRNGRPERIRKSVRRKPKLIRRLL
jgi:hypothetical protein